MEIILMEKVQKLGEIGDVVKVKAGYARNYLLPQGKAMIANKENKLVFDEKKAVIESENLKRKKEAETFSKKLINGESIENEESLANPECLKEFELVYKNLKNNYAK